MPESEYVWIPREELLSFEELDRVVRAFRDLGVTKLRITGGEPLLRRDFPDLMRRLASIGELKDIAATTNGVLLPRLARELAAAGLRRVTISLDTLRSERFRELTRRDNHGDVLAGIAAARAAGLPIKLNCVVMRGINDDEIVELIEFAASHDAQMRFIEYMDVGGATRWEHARVVSRAEMIERLSAHYGNVTPLPHDDRAPAERFRLPDGLVVGVIASTTAPFCRDCDRARLTADGVLYTCLYAKRGTDLKGPLRSGVSDGQLRELISDVWRRRADRGAELRRSETSRTAFVPVEALRKDYRLEMHTRGG